MARMNAKGRNHYTRHTRIDHSMMETAAWHDLSGSAVKVLLHLAKLEDGLNNGDLRFGVHEAAASAGLSKNAAGRALVELQDHGFITPTIAGHFAVKTRVATCWRLTWAAWPRHGGPTNDFRDWRPE